MHLIPFVPLALLIPLIVGICVAFLAFLFLLTLESYERRSIRITVVILVTGIATAGTFGVLMLINQNQAKQTAISEIKRVYQVSLVDEQVEDLLNNKVVQLNDGRRVELRQKADGTYKLVQPLAPRDVPVGSNLAQR